LFGFTLAALSCSFSFMTPARLTSRAVGLVRQILLAITIINTWLIDL